MEPNQYERDYVAGHRHPVMRWIVLIAVIAIVGAGISYVRETGTDRDIQSAGTQGDRVGSLRQSKQGDQPSGLASAAGEQPQGTSGSGDALAAGVDSPAVISELDTITGTNDGHELIGRKV